MAADGPPPLPWHLVDVWWNLAEPPGEFVSLSMDVTLDRDMPSDVFNLYVAPISGDFGKDASFYGGIQTNVGGYPAARPDDRSGPYHKGRGAIFSRWGRGLDLSFVRAEAGGFVEAAGYEGDFVSGRRLLPWKAGAYRFELRREPDKGWVGAYVIDAAAKKETRVARLKFEGKSLRLSRSFASFIEFYDGKPVDVGALPPLEVRFGFPRINGRAARLSKIDVRHPRPPEQVGAPALMTAELSDDGRSVVCRLHNRVVDGRPAEYRLFPKP